MSHKAPFPLPIEYGLERDVQINSSNVINMYSIPTDACSQQNCWVPVSGFRHPKITGNGEVRAQFVYRNVLYLVSGSGVYSMDSGGLVTFLGAISAITGYVGITANETQVIFVTGAIAYIWDIVATTFSTVVFGFPIVPADVAMLDNFFIIPDQSTQKFYVSALNNGHMWNVINFAIFQSHPDTLVACHILKRRLFLFGQRSIETWFDAGAAIFPLRRDNNALYEHGCASPNTIRTIGAGDQFEILIYLARSNDGSSSVMMIEGESRPQKISSIALDYFLEKNIVNPQDSDAILYKENGLTFYQLNFTTDNASFLYVLETKRWHSLRVANGDRHPAVSHSFFFGKHYIGVKGTTFLYEMSSNFFTYDKELIRCFLVTKQYFSSNNNRLRMDKFTLELTTGMPSVTLPIQYDNEQVDSLIRSNQEPDAILSISRDGGRTFGNGRRVALGKYGEYMRQVVWRRLGSRHARRFVVKIEIPYKIPFVIIGAYADMEVLPE